MPSTRPKTTEVTWGSEFKRLRTQAGLSLRVIHQRFGFDPASVSRHENGIMNPSPERLEAYAKMLRLEPGSAEWNRFFALAMEKTGRFQLPFWPLRRAKQRHLSLLESAILMAKEDGVSNDEIMEIMKSMDAIVIQEQDDVHGTPEEFDEAGSSESASDFTKEVRRTACK
jgi:transcriptional regulator with XRE-family HTH domain